MGEKSSEIPKPDKSRNNERGVVDPSRRRFLIGTAATIGAIAAGAIGIKGYRENSPELQRTREQNMADKFIDQAEKEESLIKFKIVNKEDPEKPVNYRKSPARLGSNWMSDFEPDKEIEGIIVRPISGYQEAMGDESNWIAFRSGGALVGFVHSDYVERKDGSNFYLPGTKIYDLEKNSVTVVGPGSELKSSE